MYGYYGRPLAISLGDGRVDLISTPVEIPSDMEYINYISKEGDTGESISHDFYGRSDFYHLICLFNNIETPYFIEPGTNLTIPHPNNVI